MIGHSEAAEKNKAIIVDQSRFKISKKRESNVLLLLPADLIGDSKFLERLKLYTRYAYIVTLVKHVLPTYRISAFFIKSVVTTVANSSFRLAREVS